MLQTVLRSRSLVLALPLALTALASFGLGQVSTTAIHGVIRDPSGAAIPGAAVKLKDTGTSIEKSTTGSAEGTFVFSSLEAATYQITVSAAGFQTAVQGGVVVDTGRTTDVAITLAVGSSTQTVEVAATGGQLQTTSNEIGATLDNKAIQNLPYSSRDTLNFSLLTAGAVSNGGSSTFNGLPNASMNITIDGMDNNSERFKSGGTSFYTFAPERIDAVDEATVSTAGQGADAGGMGAMSIRFTTKRGTEQYHFTAGEQFANEDLNANSFFGNLRGQPISRTRQNNPYGSVGGPLLPFIPKMKHKLFFFAYFEAQPQPGSTTLTTKVLTPDAAAGNFTYLGTDGVTRTVNLLQSAGAAGFTNTIDPTVGKMLNDIKSSQSLASGFLPITGQPYWNTMEWTQGTNSTQLYPSARVDYQIAANVAWHGTWNLHHYVVDGSAPPYPGETQYAYTNAYSLDGFAATSGIDWTISPRMVDTATFGVQGNAETFYSGSDPSQWAPFGNRALYSPLINSSIPNPIAANVLPFIRNNPVYQFRDDLNWAKGKHTILLGGVVKHTSFYEESYGSAGVPTYTLGIASGDPITTALQSALPAVNTGNGDLTNAENLYALLTGRVSAISGNVNVNENTHQYTPGSPVTQRYAFTTAGIYLQDNFRVSQSLSLNFGLRWQLDGAYHSTNGIDAQPAPGAFFGPSNGLFQPGVLNGNLNPMYVQVNNPYKADLLNPAPNVGFAWNPSADGLLGKILGNKKTVIRGGFSITYYNEGLNTISNVLSSNPGATQSISATPGNAGFPIGGINLSSPAPPLISNPTTFGFPVPEANQVFTGGQTLYYVNPNLVSPYVTNWNLDIQRELPGRTVIEVRYIGNKSTHMWHYQNVNETNIFENGFLTQFQQAQKNLSINAANGVPNNFSNRGFAGEAAIPIFEGAFGANGSQPALAASSGFGNSTFITDLQQGLAGTLANSIASTSSNTYYCRLIGSNFAPCAKAGFTSPSAYPINLFRANPFASGLQYQDDNGNDTYNGLQVEVRKALSHGLTVNANFTWSHALGDLLNASDQTATYQWFTQRDGRLSYGPAPNDRRFVFNSYWTYDLPFGKNKSVNITNGLLDRIVGGWTLGGIETITSGGPTLITSGRGTFNNLFSSGVVYGGGLTPNQLQQDLSTIPDMNHVIGGNLISNVGSIASSSGIANPAFYAPNSTPGQFGTLAYIYGKTSFGLNMSLNKSVRIHERLNVGFRLEALNFLNHPFFSSLGSSSVTSNSFGQVSSASGTRTVLLRAYMSW